MNNRIRFVSSVPGRLLEPSYAHTHLSVKPKRAMMDLCGTKQRKTNVYLLDVVPFAVKFVVPQKTSVLQRASTHGAPHARLMPERSVDSEQELVSDGTVASGAHCLPLFHIFMNTKWSNRYFFVFFYVHRSPRHIPNQTLACG